MDPYISDERLAFHAISDLRDALAILSELWERNRGKLKFDLDREQCALLVGSAQGALCRVVELNNRSRGVPVAPISR